MFLVNVLNETVWVVNWSFSSLLYKSIKHRAAKTGSRLRVAKCNFSSETLRQVLFSIRLFSKKL